MPDLLFLGLVLVVIGVELVKTTNNNVAITDSVTVLFIIYLIKNQLITNKNSPVVGEGKYTLFFEIINARGEGGEKGEWGERGKGGMEEERRR